MSGFMTLAKDRYSVRKFAARPVEDAVIDQILQAGHLAPTACNLQPQKVLVLKSETALEKLKKCTDCHFHAPLALLICYDKERSWKRSFDGKDSGYVDASIVTTHMMLAAAELGVGSTWVMWFDPEAVRREYALAENVEPVALLPLGYPAENAKPAHLHEKYRAEEEIITVL